MIQPSGGGLPSFADLPPEIQQRIFEIMQSQGMVPPGAGGMQAAIPNEAGQVGVPGSAGMQNAAMPSGGGGLPGPGTPGWFRARRRLRNGGGGGMQAMPMPSGAGAPEPDVDQAGGPSDMDVDDRSFGPNPMDQLMGGRAEAPAGGRMGLPSATSFPQKAPEGRGAILSGGAQLAPPGGRGPQLSASPGDPDAAARDSFLKFMQRSGLGRR